MLSVEDALTQVLSMFEPLEPERVSLLDSLGRVLAQDVTSDIDIPPNDNSAMDGYAVIAADAISATQETPVRLRIVENLAAGYVAQKDVVPGTAIRIMTGAPVPRGADAVIRFERTRQQDDWVDLFFAPPVGNNIRYAGEDVRRGDLILCKGTPIRPQEVGMLASLGYAEVSVIRRPRVAILATGDELVDLDEPLAPGKIRNSNGYSNAAQVLKYGGVPIMLGIARDTEHDLTAKIQAGLEQGVDLFLTSGGVSVGDFDVVKKVLAAEGEMTFWRVRMKPGKPLAFGTLKTAGGRVVPMLGMPGNPVSVMVSFEIFARPALLKMLGFAALDKPTVDAILVDAIESKDERRHYVRVHVTKENDVVKASLTGGQGSGILNSMVKANGFAIIPEDWTHAPAGSRVKVMLFD
ncbi:MAG: molybdopterin molybdotransferase MoeA [Anaerolineae bacterium]|nr:molybdopterin molybdotransferase MoeA [Anaerolineae bacterium]